MNDLIGRMRKSTLIFAAWLLVGPYALSQSPTPSPSLDLKRERDDAVLAIDSVGKNNEEAFVNASYSRLSTKASGDQIRGFELTLSQWKATKSEKDWVKLTDAIHYAAAAAGAISQVSIAASRGPGASVKYQTIGERQRGEPPTSAKGLTTLKESMSVGLYHVWSERGGKATSDKNARFPIVNAIETIVLSEQ